MSSWHIPWAMMTQYVLYYTGQIYFIIYLFIEHNILMHYAIMLDIWIYLSLILIHYFNTWFVFYQNWSLGKNIIRIIHKSIHVSHFIYLFFCLQYNITQDSKTTKLFLIKIVSIDRFRLVAATGYWIIRSNC